MLENVEECGRSERAGECGRSEERNVRERKNRAEKAIEQFLSENLLPAEMKLRKLPAEMRKAVVDHNTVRSCDALSCQFCGGPVDGCPPARGPCPDEAHSSLRTACLPILHLAALDLYLQELCSPHFSHG